jgi:hypothetical protein
MNAGEELARLLRRSGAKLVKHVGNHQAWQLQNGKTIRISTRGRRPNYIVRELLRQIRSAGRAAQNAKAE